MRMSSMTRVMEPVVKAAIAKAPMVIIGGGDGTLSSDVDHFVGKDTVFAVLPLGTANSFARTLGLPLDIDGAIDVIAHGRRKRIDLGDDRRRLFRQCRGNGAEPVDRRYGAARAEALSRHGRLFDLGDAGGVPVPAVPAERHAGRRDDGQMLGDRGADRQRRLTMAASSWSKARSSTAARWSSRR